MGDIITYLFVAAAGAIFGAVLLGVWAYRGRPREGELHPIDRL
jgi:hypothetical protein